MKLASSSFSFARLRERAFPLVLLTLAACGKMEAPPPSRKATATRAPISSPESKPAPPQFDKAAYLAKQSPETRSRFDQLDIEDEAFKKYEKEDQQLYVKPAPPDFKPEDASRKIKLTLIPQKTTLRVGERFRYRLEVQNVGRDEISFFEMPSFIKTGSFDFEKFKFYALLPDGKEIQLHQPTWRGEIGSEAFNPPGFSRLSDKDKEAWVKRLMVESKVAYNLSVTLKPGDILYTRPWGISENQLWLERALQAEDKLDPRRHEPGSFRNLVAEHIYEDFFDAMPPTSRLVPGSYRIKAVYEDRKPKLPAEWDMQWYMKQGYSRQAAEQKQMSYYKEALQKYLGRVESNVVSFKVLP